MLTLKRTYHDDRTDGVILLPNTQVIRTLELPWRDNKVNVSCIPEDQYIIEPDNTGRHQWFRVLNVPNRTFIEIHQATKTEHLLGCIGIYTVEDLRTLQEWFGGNSWVLNIVEDKKC